MDQDSSDEESVLSDDTGFASDASEYETDIEEKFIPAAEIHALNDRTKYCMIQSCYTTGGPLTVCAACMVLLANIDTVGMHYIKKHSINYIDALNAAAVLEDAREIVLGQVRDAVERHGSVKVNTAFNGEFATKDKRAIKSINTKNSEIYDACITSARARNCRRTKWTAKDSSDEKFELLTRKGIFPYEYIDSVEKLQDTRLPSRELFFSSLTGDTVSESDYAHAVNVWQRFSIRTLGEYSDLYLKTDVLLLADIFENFRNNCVASYILDPAHYCTLPGFTWDAMLKHTRIKFELLTNIDMVMFIERGICGGLSQCSGRYAQANNKYMRSYDSSKPSSYLMYYDVNNLYGWEMCQPLPYAEFRWVEDAANFDASAIAPDSSTGYILEVDLEYPQRLHDRHTDLPFCPMRDKPPIELITQFRMHAKNDFEKNLYKLMNNAVFGKTMENVRNHVDVKLLTKWDGRYGAEAMIAKPNFHSRSVFAENLIAVELRKLEMKFDKPIYVGMCILDISKVCLYKFHCEYMSPMFQVNCKIMYTDTDSLIYRIECEDVYETMKRDIARFDTSDYPADNVYGMPLANKKKPGLMKDENNGMIMTEFVGLRAKMYAVRVDGKKDTKKVKGVKSNVVARTITFNDYTRYLNEEIEMTRRQ
ncbi:hypothetical protein ALC57_03967 [Trachymyrmex cornetzi]|uniref:DNA-directed DNA polymerase n=1 Tax=Trachymyrmex cornetzi TaxID=471704 RepID=A0A151JLQ2_9HYME|nr:hypothetical protein ALC57_03967 [Trachymyrmex cornetzi]